MLQFIVLARLAVAVCFQRKIGGDFISVIIEGLKVTSFTKKNNASNKFGKFHIFFGLD